jgi:predicted metalloprotease with PDZ domain
MMNSFQDYSFLLSESDQNKGGMNNSDAAAFLSDKLSLKTPLHKIKVH